MMVDLENTGNRQPQSSQEGTGQVGHGVETSASWSFPAFAKALEVLPTSLDVWHFAWFTFCVSITKGDVCCKVSVDALQQTKEIPIYPCFAKSFFLL